MFDCEGSAAITAMRDLAVRVYEELDITSKLELDIRMNYTELILRGAAQKNANMSC